MSDIAFECVAVEVPVLKPDALSDWLTKVILSYHRQIGAISFVFCSDDYLLRIHQDYLKRNDYTDIITFDYSEGSRISGDLFISYDRIVENASTYGNGDVFDEFCRVSVHGILHLIGFKDATSTEKEAMRQEEDKHLSSRLFHVKQSGELFHVKRS